MAESSIILHPDLSVSPLQHLWIQNLLLWYVKDEVATTSASEKDEDAARNLETKNTKAGDSESKAAEAEKQKDPDEELYWIQPYGEENQEPIVITVYKK